MKFSVEYREINTYELNEQDTQKVKEFASELAKQDNGRHEFHYYINQSLTCLLFDAEMEGILIDSDEEETVFAIDY